MDGLICAKCVRASSACASLGLDLSGIPSFHAYDLSKQAKQPSRRSEHTSQQKREEAEHYARVLQERERQRKAAEEAEKAHRAALARAAEAERQRLEAERQKQRVRNTQGVCACSEDVNSRENSVGMDLIFGNFQVVSNSAVVCLAF